MAKEFTNPGPVPVFIGDTEIAVGGSDVISDEEYAVLLLNFDSTHFQLTGVSATNHYDSLSYGAGLTSEDR